MKIQSWRAFLVDGPPRYLTKVKNGCIIDDIKMISN